MGDCSKTSTALGFQPVWTLAADAGLDSRHSHFVKRRLILRVVHLHLSETYAFSEVKMRSKGC